MRSKKQSLISLYPDVSRRVLKNERLESFGKPLNTSLATVSINHMLWLMLLVRIMLLGYTLTMKQIGYQCAWLCHNYPVEWVASFLDREPETRKEKAINLAKQHGYDIKPLNVNYSEGSWKIQDDKTLVAPLTTIKGLGVSALEQIMSHRPFNTVEEMLFHPDIKYAKLNKKAFDVLCRAGAMNDLIDERFTGDKHFWSAVCLDKPRTKKKLDENIETYRPEGSFSEQEKIEFLADLTGIFPMSIVISPDVQRRLDERFLPPISEFDPELQLCWCIPRSVLKKKTRNGKNFYVIKVIDSNSVETQIRCWGVNIDKDIIHVNRPYLLKPRYDQTWGFSTNGNVDTSWALLG